jgi:hypothetical protein
MFDAIIAAQFKVSNTPLLTGLISTMTIIKILDHLQDSYGKPNMMTLFNNNTLFWSPLTPGNSPEMLFYLIKQCQEIPRTGKVLYLDNQIIATAVSILVTSNMFPLKNFDAWEAMANKTYPALKTFFHKAYRQRLSALELRSMPEQNGYTNQTMYNILEGDDNTANNTATSLIQTVAATAAGTTATFAGMSGVTTPTIGVTINTDFAASINQLAANQTTIVTQMAALSFAQEPDQHTRFVARDAFQVPPIQQLTIRTQQAPFQAGAFHAGCGGRQGGLNRGCRHGRRACTLFVDYMRTAGASRNNAQPHLDKEGYNRYKIPITPTYTNGIIIGTFVSHVDLT